MTEIHQKALEKLTGLHQNNPAVLALIICGSLAAGTERKDSDVDLYLVVSDEEYERVDKTKEYFYGTWDPDAFFGLEIDGKIINLRFLREAADKASEPTRASFLDAYAAFSHKPEINELIKKIAVYPERERTKKIKAFYAYTKHYRYIAEQGFNQGNDYYSKRCVMELVFYASRLVLAHNRILFPCHKSLFKALEKASDMPEGFIGMSLDLLRKMDLPGLIDYYEKVISYFKQYDYPDAERIGFILENEWSWFSHVPFAGDI